MLELASKESIKPFKLSMLPLIRATLYKLAEFEHVLIINMHHIVTDGLSIGLLLDELDVFYRSFTHGTSSSASELDIQYADYALWQRHNIDGDTYKQQINYWQTQLKSKLPVMELPCDKTRPAVQSFKGSNVFFTIPKHLYQELLSLGNKEGCTFFMTLLAVFGVILGRYSGAEDIIIGTPIANRTLTEVEPLIGNFLNMIPIRLDLSGNPTFIELLNRIKETTLSAFTNKDLPFEKIVENLQFERDPSRNPIFQVMLQLLLQTEAKIGDLEISSYHFDTKFAQFDLSLHLYEEFDGYFGRFEYCSDLFNSSTIERLSQHFIELLKGIVKNPQLPISEISLLNDKEREQILFDWNKTVCNFPKNKCLHQLFEEIVDKVGNRIAAEFDGQSLTYTDLNSKANQLANYLIKAGVKPETFVGIYIERSLNLLIGIFAIWKIGAAYVPMDPAFPPDRLTYMMEDAEISILVTEKHLIDVFPQSNRLAICIDTDWPKIQIEDSHNLDTALDSGILAYTIYTSGSTGKPKGVMIEHRSVVNFLFSMQKEPGFTEDDVLMAVTTISFDIAVLELFLPLITGGKIVIASNSETIDGNLLMALIERTNATVMQATPATWKLMIEAGWEKTPNLKMLCGGEPLPRDLANKMLERGGELWNMYGPTETTIWSSVQKIEAGNDPILIGPPIANTQFYVVDKEMEPVPIGVAGELLIGGDGLSRGYLNRSNLTAERFIKNPFPNSHARIYRTGDLARFRPNGEVEFLGRLDFQVKVRGFRIELGEIENILTQHDEIKEAVVVAQEDEKNDKGLVAYFIPEYNKDLRVSELRKFLGEKLPYYMIPRLFVKMDRFPLTSSGKIDRKAFPEPKCPAWSPNQCMCRQEMSLNCSWQLFGKKR